MIADEPVSNPRSVASARQELFGVRDGGTIGWSSGAETEETRNFTEDDMRSMRREIIERNNRVDSLHSSFNDKYSLTSFS